MGSGWHEWPLMIFTVFGQCVAGGFIVLALALLKGDLRAEAQQRVIACMFGLWVLMGIGFIASMLHLGSPMRAFNSLNRVGASALSNEIASGSIFFAVGGIGWLLAMLKKLSPALRTLWLIVTMVLGVIFVWMMVRVYNSIDTVPTWYSIWTPMGFFLTMFMGGPLLGYLLLSLAGVDGWAMRLLPAISVLALVVSGVVSVMQGAELATIHSSVQQAGRSAGAGLWCADVLADRAFGRCPVLVDCTTAKRLSACGSATIRLIHSASGRGINRSRRILWFAYDRGDGRRKLISNNRGFGPGSLLFLLR